MPFLKAAIWKEPETDAEKLQSTSVSNKMTYLLNHIKNTKDRHTHAFGSPLKLRNPMILSLCSILLVDKLVCKSQWLVGKYPSEV